MTITKPATVKLRYADMIAAIRKAHTEKRLAAQHSADTRHSSKCQYIYPDAPGIRCAIGVCLPPELDDFLLTVSPAQLSGDPDGFDAPFNFASFLALTDHRVVEVEGDPESGGRLERLQGLHDSWLKCLPSNFDQYEAAFLNYLASLEEGLKQQVVS